MKFKELQNYVVPTTISLLMLSALIAFSYFFPTLFPSENLSALLLVRPAGLEELWLIPAWGALLAVLDIQLNLKSAIKARWGDDQVFSHAMASGDADLGVEGRLAEKRLLLKVVQSALMSLFLVTFSCAVPLVIDEISVLRFGELARADFGFIMSCGAGIWFAVVRTIFRRSDWLNSLVLGVLLFWASVINGLLAAFAICFLFDGTRALVHYIGKRVYWYRHWYRYERPVSPK